MNDLIPLIALTIAVLFVVLGLRGAIRAVFGSKTKAVPKQPSGRAVVSSPSKEVEFNTQSILVDGSNVMHWDKNEPNPATLKRVLAALRNAKNDPILCFDANVGYKIANTHMGPTDLAKFFGVRPNNILICPSGTDADAMILRIAVEKSLPVVTNDYYRDYPELVAQVNRMTGRISGTEVDLKLRRKTPVSANS